MKKLLYIVFLSLCLTQTSIAYPTITPEQDFVCATQTYGMRVTPELDKKVEERIKELDAQVKFIFDIDISDVMWGYGVIEEPTVAGATYAQFGPGLILFNPVYLNKYKEDFIKVVVRHEISHIVTYRLFGATKETHGKEWRFVMQRLGDKSPKQYHNYTFCDEGNIPFVFTFQ